MSRVAIIAAFALILGIPFLLRPAQVTKDHGKDSLVIITPHVPQIRTEFEEAFSAWHQRKFGSPVRIDWRVPGGTSEIVKVLESVYGAAAKEGQFNFTDPKNPTCKPGAIPFDLMLGGGSFDHGRLKTGIKVQGGDLPMSVPAGFSKEQLDGWFGENKIGSGILYDPDQFWIGNCLSGFGIVYNKEILARMEVKLPESFKDLTDPRLIGMVALADPRQSGSITTTMEAILNSYGWEEGWKLLREMCANTRYFTNSSTKPPIDVSQGEGAVGLAIDFYGRSQSQAVLKPGQAPEESRVGYIDPVGTVYIDADPASILRGGPNFELSKRFVEFTLTEEGQALWQFPAQNNPRSASNPVGESGQKMGPRQYELRRMPIRRVMYAKYSANMIDKIEPFAAASTTKSKGWRSSIGIMLGAFSIDIADQQRAAWKVLNRVRNDPSFPASTRADMETLFYAFPEQTMPDGTKLLFSEANYKAIRAIWNDKAAQTRAAIDYTAFFRNNYDRIVEIERTTRANR